MAPPPVATTTSTAFISACVVSTEPCRTVCTRSSGAPWSRMMRWYSLVRNQVESSAFGWGAKMMALPALSANTALHMGVTIGLVTGHTAPTTPMGLAMSTRFCSVSSPMMPRDFFPFRLFQITRALLFVLVDAESGLLVGHGGDRLGVVVDVFAEIPYDCVDLFLRKRLEDRLRGTRAPDEIVDRFRRGGGRLFDLAADRGFKGRAGHCFSSFASSHGDQAFALAARGDLDAVRNRREGDPAAVKQHAGGDHDRAGDRADGGAIPQFGPGRNRVRMNGELAVVGDRLDDENPAVSAAQAAADRARRADVIA